MISSSSRWRSLRVSLWASASEHAHGVVHRDVKPDNILLEASGGRALVTDFGIAQAGGGQGLTGSTEILGTAEFMSPEQASGEAVDGRSDMYALGIVGHYMLTGELPFQGSTVAATLAKQLTQEAPAGSCRPSSLFRAEPGVDGPDLGDGLRGDLVRDHVCDVHSG